MRLQIGSQIAAAHRVARVDARRSREVRICFFHFTFQNQRPAQVIFSNEIILGDREGVRPQIIIALPVSDLAMRAERQDNEDQRRGNGSPKTEFLLFGPIRSAERDHHENADQRNVGVTVGHGGFPHLHQANHGNQRP